MQPNPIAEWQRLTALYREMSDEELRALNAGIDDLTEQAQQALQSEMSSRKLSSQPPDSPDGDYPDPEPSAGSIEFTWKTPLCTCTDGEQATELQAALKASGIDSWIDGAGYRITPDMLNPRILVAADQLDRARQIISQPIPQAIIEQTKVQEEEYTPPLCPSCGAEDPTLEAVDPVNSWLCESCGHQWSDPVQPTTQI